MKRAIDGYHPFEHFHKAIQGNVQARIDPRVYLRASRERKTIRWFVSKGSVFSGLKDRFIVRCCRLDGETRSGSGGYQASEEEIISTLKWESIKRCTSDGSN